MKKLPRLFAYTCAVACLLTACGSDEREENYKSQRCPNLNGTYAGEGGSAVIDTRVEGDEENPKFKYNFGDGMIWLEAGGEAFKVPYSENALWATCGYQNVTLHTRMNGQENEVTYADGGDNVTMHVSSQGYSQAMKRTGDAPTRKQR